MPTIEISELSPQEAASFSEIEDLEQKIFAEPYSRERLEARVAIVQNKQNILLLVARLDGKSIGYKWGYEAEPGIFYSWIGGVAPEARGGGVARALMDYQHAWCRARGLLTVRTTTRNRFREMLILNLRAGFDIVAASPHEDGEIRIKLQKRL